MATSSRVHNVSKANSDTNLNLRNIDYDVDDECIVVYLEQERARANMKAEENTAEALEFIYEVTRFALEITQ